MHLGELEAKYHLKAATVACINKKCKCKLCNAKFVRMSWHQITLVQLHPHCAL